MNTIKAPILINNANVAEHGYDGWTFLNLHGTRYRAMWAITRDGAFRRYVWPLYMRMRLRMVGLEELREVQS